MKSSKSDNKSMAKSPVIKPGTGSGSRPMAGNTKTKMSNPSDSHGLGRKPPGALK